LVRSRLPGTFGNISSCASILLLPDVAPGTLRFDDAGSTSAAHRIGPRLRRALAFAFCDVSIDARGATARSLCSAACRSLLWKVKSRLLPTERRTFMYRTTNCGCRFPRRRRRRRPTPSLVTKTRCAPYRPTPDVSCLGSVVKLRHCCPPSILRIAQLGCAVRKNRINFSRARGMIASVNSLPRVRD